ncbi:MAG: DegT/DnrJ/EryC1/StrS family aminotransferase, partial [Spirochaetales bacterium]|nr:DegT/DnrJ/EryC1/StrS family aminotransferase [Spirochaetales bacterium]
MLKDRKAGTLGDFGNFSFQASKNLPGGEGGMLITNSRDYLYHATTLGHYRRAANLPE